MVKATTGDRIGTLIRNNVALVSALIIAFQACWQLALVVVGIFPLLVLAGWLQMRMTSGLNKKGKDSLESVRARWSPRLFRWCDVLGVGVQAGHYANEALTSIRTVHAFGLQREMQRKFDEVCWCSSLIAFCVVATRAIHLVSPRCIRV